MPNNECKQTATITYYNSNTFFSGNYPLHIGILKTTESHQNP